METKTIILALIILLLFIFLLVGIVYIMIKASLEIEEVVEKEQLGFLNWVTDNCNLNEHGIWLYESIPYTNEEIVYIYSNLEDE